MGDVGAAAMHNSTAADCEQLPTPHGLDTWREHMLLLACIIILGAYHGNVYKVMMNEPTKTSLGHGNEMRRHWCRFMITHSEHAVLAVQSMRNEIMWGAFLGLTSFTALTVIMSSALSSDDMTCSFAAMSRYDPFISGYRSSFSGDTKVMLINFLLSFVFLCSLQYLRILRHLSLYVGCSKTEFEKDELMSVTARMYNMAAFFHWLAMRILFMMMASTGWLFGPTYAVVTSLLFVVYQHRNDKISVEPMRYQPQCDEEGVPAVEGEVAPPAQTQAREM